jgi:hypothetical protein
MKKVIYASSEDKWKFYWKELLQLDGEWVQELTKNKVVFQNGDVIYYINPKTYDSNTLCGMTFGDIVVGDIEGLKCVIDNKDEFMVCMLEMENGNV